MLAAAIAASLLIHAAPAPQDTSTAALRREIARIAAESGAHVGVGVVDLRTGQSLSVNGDEGFQMQSVFKLPVAIALLRRVDAGQVRLGVEMNVTAADLRAGHSPIADQYPNGGARFTVRELLRRMVSESDNTAADLLLPLAGGPAGVTRTMRALGVTGVRVDRGEGRLALDFHGIAWAPGREPKRVVDSLAAQIPPERLRAAIDAYLRDPRDTATPDGMARLLALLARGRLLSPRSTALLLEMMTETPTGPNRLRGMLPAGTRVAHKTGSGDLAGVTAVVNDVGIVTLPDGGRVAIAVFTKRSPRGVEAAERAIAQVSRAVYDRAARRGR
ncbi:MAG TPA: class A beta-lactamase [Longimicrobium sp.]